MASTIEGYDPLAFLPSPLPFGGNSMPHLDYMAASSQVDPLDQYSNFDSEYMSGDEMSFAHSGGLAHQALMKRMSTGFEDPFADGTMSQFDQVASEGMGENTSMDRDSKYLSFSMPNFPYRLYNESFQQCYINIQAQLHGMFFLAESQWPANMDTAPPPPELTCYRRNLFQITGSATLPRSLRYIFTEDGQRIPIYELELAVSSTESVEGNPVKIISVPWKTPTGGEASKPEDKIEREPPTIPLDKLSGSDMESDFHTVPIQWKRLQFRIATANNGRRKELQQHFTLHLKVVATVSTGEKFCIAESRSGAVIVRGRSPRNFAARKDVPLSSSSTSRKHIPSIPRSGDSQNQITSASKVQSPSEDIPRSLPQFDTNELPKQEVDLNGWQQTPHAFPDQISNSYSMSMNPSAQITFTGAPTPSPDPLQATPFNFAFSPPEVPNSSGAMSLHFQSDDEGGSPFAQQQSSRPSSKAPTSNPSPSLMNKPRAATYASISPNLSGEPPKQRPRMHSHHSSITSVPPMTTGATITSGPTSNGLDRPALVKTISNISTNSAAGLYEYFPLSIEDWQPPVDAVFRPHVVHHEAPIDLRSPPGRSKRYFSEVV